MNKKESTSSEPYFYIALVLKGTEQQYLKLLEYINNQNAGQVVYQCKSLTYLRVSREDNIQLQATSPEIVVESHQS